MLEGSASIKTVCHSRPVIQVLEDCIDSDEPGTVSPPLVLSVCSGPLEVPGHSPVVGLMSTTEIIPGVFPWDFGDWHQL